MPQPEIKPAPCRELTKESFAWLAGLLEGEGRFHRAGSSLRYPHLKYPTVFLGMTDADVVAKAAGMMIAVCGTRARIRTRLNPPHKPVYVFSLAGKHAATVIRVVLPHLGMRRRAKAQQLLVEYGLRHNKRTRRKPAALYSRKENADGSFVVTRHSKAHQRGVIYMPSEAWRDLKVGAAKHGMSMGELVMKLIELVDAAPAGKTAVYFTKGEFVRNDSEREKP